MDKDLSEELSAELRGFEARRFNQNFEEGMVIYKNGQIKTFTGDNESVVLSGDKTGAITTHNHPISASDMAEGITTNTIFSSKDLNSFVNNFEKEMRMVTYDAKKKRNVVLSIKKTKDVSWTDFDLFKEGISKTYKDFTRKNIASGWNKMAVNKNVSDLHKQMKDMAKKYNYVYKQTYL